MVEMLKYPFMMRRKGSRNLCYKRPVPSSLHAPGRKKQIWRTLGTDNDQVAKVAYRQIDEEIDALFAQWQHDDHCPKEPALPNHSAAVATTTFTPLTPALLRRLADVHYIDVYEADFQWRGELCRTHEDEAAFWRGKIIRHPKNDWHNRKDPSHSYYARLMEEPVLEEIFLYCVFYARKERLQRLRRQYQLGDPRSQVTTVDTLLRSKELIVSELDRNRLARKLMEVESMALEDLITGDEATFDGIVERQSAERQTPELHPPSSQAGSLMSSLVEKYLEDTAREREWPCKTLLRKRGELREFMEIAGNKCINKYQREDGVRFKDIQLALPVYRQKAPFKGLTLADAAKRASELRAIGEKVDLLNPITINDKIGTVSLFFEWAKSRDASVVNPAVGQGMRRAMGRRQGKKRHPWTIEELNRLVAAPIYTGCESEYCWTRPGEVILCRSAKFWVPLIGLFSGMRLGEIIQMQVDDVKNIDGINYFDVTPVVIDLEDAEADAIDEEEKKSLKTPSSRRGIPIHNTLVEVGFEAFVTHRRAAGDIRLFPDYNRAKDDGSWSKQFSKHFKRFRESIGVRRRGVKFHSLRHNVEDALRNADVRKEVRDAIQGHGESGVSREYGSGYYLKTLNEAVQKIMYEGLIFDQLRSGDVNCPRCR